MISITVNGENAASKAFLWEVTIQCQIARLIYGRLAEWARVQVTRDFGATNPRPRSGIEVLADCATFLSACAILSRCLFGKGGQASHRSKKLRELLNVHELPALRALKVRNAFEHIDERLDLLLQQNPTDTIVQIHLARKAPSARLVLKRFNPDTMTLHYLDEEMNLAACAQEVNLLNTAVLGLAGRKRSDIGLLPPRDGKSGRGG